MFSSQSIDYSLSTPARCLASLPPRSSSSAAAKSKSNSDDEQDGWDDDDSFQFDDANTQDTHRFLVGTAFPSITKTDSENDLNNDDESNQLHLLTYHEDSHEITLDASYPHPGEIWALAPHPKNDTLVTCGGGVYLESGEDGTSSDNQLMEFKTQLWKIPDGDDEGFGLGPSLESLIVIPHGENITNQNAGWEKRVGCILWNPILSSDDPFEDQEMAGGSLLTVGWEACSPIALWDLSASVAVETWSSSTSSSNRRKRYNLLQSALPRRASWDPHQPTTILCSEVQDVRAYDTRMSSGTGIGVVRNAHRYGVTDIDHNRLQEHVIVTSGMDGVIKFWDLRMHLSSNEENSSLPPADLLKIVRGGHSHWSTRASYNPFHDQLVISGGTDGIANLWRISSCSSAPLLDFDGDDDVNNGGEDPLEDEGGDEGVGGSGAKEEGEEEINPVDNDYSRGEEKKDSIPTKPPSNDIRVSRFECSDTVADVCWSVSDPWMYASLSCDGAFVVHHVPSKEKYKILL